MQSRRSLLTRLFAGLGALLVPRSLFARSHAAAAIAPLRAGDELPLGWSIESASGSTLILVNADSRKAEFDIRPLGERPIGIAQSSKFDFVLLNAGRGRKATDEDLGRVILGLARHVS